MNGGAVLCAVEGRRRLFFEKCKIMVDKSEKLRYNNRRRRERPARHNGSAAVAHLVERHLAKVEVASSSLVGRSIMEQQQLLRYGPVAQLVRAPACHAGGRRFEPDPGRSSKVLRFIWQSCKQDRRDERQTFSSSPQNLAFASFCGDPAPQAGACMPL